MIIAPQHSPIGASGMKRWKNCPGSVKLSKGIKSVSSIHAMEGTEAHEWAYKILCAYRDKKPIPYPAHLKPEMQEAIDIYVDHMRSLHKPGCLQLFEHRFHLKKLHPDLFGTADGVTYYPKTKLLIISDLKYGAGVYVDVVRNDQLLYYALGAVLTLGVAVDKIRIEIIQPRINTAEAIRPWECDIFDLLEFAEELEVYAKRTEEPNAPLAAGDWCRWCPAAAICPLLKTKSRELAERVFSPVNAVDYEELADTLDWLPILETWITSTREFAYNRAMAGDKIPRHKLVAKRATRKWTDEEAAAAKLRKKFKLSDDELYVVTRDLVSPSQLENLPFKTLGLKIKKTEVKEFVNDLVTKQSSGYSLVHETDDRAESVKVDPKSVFSSLREIEELS